jgi:hypothetical protein
MLPHSSSFPFLYVIAGAFLLIGAVVAAVGLIFLVRGWMLSKNARRSSAELEVNPLDPAGARTAGSSTGGIISGCAVAVGGLFILAGIIVLLLRVLGQM